MNYRATIFISLLLLGLLHSLGCTQAAPRVRIVQTSADVTTSSLTSAEEEIYRKLQPVADLDCEVHLAKVTCYSEKTELGYDPDCSPEAVPPEIFKEILKASQELPALPKAVLCHINRLQIQPKIFSIGYASRIINENRFVIGNMIGLRTDVLSGKGQLDLWSWKEQLNFGLSLANDPSYTLSPLGPKITQDIPDSKYPLFLSVMVHELGHLLDFMNRANKFNYEVKTEDEDKDVAPMKVIHLEGSFGHLSWPDYILMSDGSNWPPPELKTAFPRLSRLCYYSCAEFGTIDPSQMNNIYQELQQTSFITAYSSSSEQEDFAESFTHVSLMDRKIEYKIIGPDGLTLYSSIETLQSERYKKKLQWVQEFISRPNIIYRIIP